MLKVLDEVCIMECSRSYKPNEEGHGLESTFINFKFRYPMFPRGQSH